MTRDFATLPAPLLDAAILCLKQHGLVIGALRDSTSDPKNKAAFAKECRGIVYLVQAIEEHRS